MARDLEPMSEEDFEILEAEMDAQREALHEALAEDLGGEPADYRVETRTIPDGDDE